jgi:predicted  nucleic acid-binding Zn-ribbon protein
LKDQLLLLHELQEIDSQIDRFEMDLARMPSEVQNIARNLVTLRREISEYQERLESVGKELRRKEQDLATEQEKIKRSERRLLGIRNQKEHNALSREVKLGKKVVGEIEDSILELMTETDSLKALVEKRQREYAQFEKDLLEKKAEAQVVESTATSALSLLNLQKGKLTDALDRDFLRRYETIKKVRGYAVAELKNGACSACNMTIPPQVNIKVLKQQEMITCPSCHRILYVKPENIPEYNKLEA